MIVPCGGGGGWGKDMSLVRVVIPESRWEARVMEMCVMLFGGFILGPGVVNDWGISYGVSKMDKHNPQKKPDGDQK